MAACAIDVNNCAITKRVTEAVLHCEGHGNRAAQVGCLCRCRCTCNLCKLAIIGALHRDVVGIDIANLGSNDVRLGRVANCSQRSCCIAGGGVEAELAVIISFNYIANGTSRARAELPGYICVCRRCQSKTSSVNYCELNLVDFRGLTASKRSSTLVCKGQR